MKRREVEDKLLGLTDSTTTKLQGFEFLCCLHLMYVFHIFSSVRVTEWPPIGE